jgi:hypothetical protein
MNRRERRAYEAELRHAKRTETLIEPGAVDEGYMMLGPGDPPQDIRADVTRAAQAMSFHGIDGGDCFMRASIGYKVLTDLGWQPEVQLGGMLYRAGPDPYRDVVAFCGYRNKGMLWHGQLLGHVWFKLDGNEIDFSCAEWPRLYVPRDSMGPVQWQRRPPTVIWAPEDCFGWREEGAPELGEVWFCPWEGELPNFAYDRAQFQTAASAFAGMISHAIEHYSLPGRVRDWRQDAAGYAEKWRHRMRRAAS